MKRKIYYADDKVFERLIKEGIIETLYIYDFFYKKQVRNNPSKVTTYGVWMFGVTKSKEQFRLVTINTKSLRIYNSPDKIGKMKSNFKQLCKNNSVNIRFNFYEDFTERLEQLSSKMLNDINNNIFTSNPREIFNSVNQVEEHIQDNPDAIEEMPKNIIAFGKKKSNIEESKELPFKNVSIDDKASDLKVMSELTKESKEASKMAENKNETKQLAADVLFGNMPKKKFRRTSGSEMAMLDYIEDEYEKTVNSNDINEMLDMSIDEITAMESKKSNKKRIVIDDDFPDFD